MEPLDPVLTDAGQFPTEEIIAAYLGGAQPLWQALFNYIHESHPELNEEWRYYNDGKSWLLKVTKKAKTVCWVSVYQGLFRMTFYFAEKAEAAIIACGITKKLKEQFRTGKHYGAIRGLTITFQSAKDVEQAKVLIPLKLSIK
jgi:hypothetical protein